MKLIQANADQKIQRDSLTYEAWGEKLSLEQFLKREQLLRQLPWSQSGMKTWILEDENRCPLTSCETFEIPSYLSLNSKENSKECDSKIQKGISIGMASVYTEPSLRGKGYAAKMISLLLDHLRVDHLRDHLKSTNSKYHSIFCYSEIGAAYYERLGFQLVDSEEWIFDSSLGKSVSGHSYKKTSPVLRRDLKSDGISCLMPPQGFKFCAWPSLDQLDWHWKRQDIYAEFLKKPIPDLVGVKINDSSILWSVDYKYEVLRILIFNSNSNIDAESLVLAACHFAQSLGLLKVQMWANLADLACQYGELWREPHAIWQVAKKIPRSDSLAMIRPLVSDFQPLEWGGITRAIWV